MAGEIILQGSNYLIEIDTETPLSAPRGVNYRPVLCEVSSTFNLTTGELAVSNRCSTGWGAGRPGTRRFTFGGEFQAINPLTGEGDVASIDEIAKLAAAATTFWIRRALKSGAEGVEVYREGKVFITNYEDTSSVDEPFTFSAEFRGTGTPETYAGYQYVGALYDKEGNQIVDKAGNTIIARK